VLAQLILAAFEQPFPNGDDAPLTARVSIGIAAAEAADDGETLARNADLAMYRAKSEGTGYAVYDPSMHRELLERLAIVQELPGAIERGELRLEYQPTVSIADGRLVGAEALVRWDHPRHGTMGPGAFVPLAEQHGLITDVGRWVLREACRQTAEWSRTHGVRLVMDVNVTAADLKLPGFVDEVLQTVRECGLPPDQLVLELTESCLVAEVDSCIAALDELRANGIRIAIDDFGTGYSSLTYLHRLPVDILKIDRSFVTGIDAPGNRNRQIVQAIMTLAKELGIVVIGEGVEHPGELAVLRELRCDIVQGYLTGRPLRPAQIEERLEPPAWMAA
jgi:EAL domain-containing protein (putative c-di-GMP-specific phosphodiesterase class I)